MALIAAAIAVMAIFTKGGKAIDFQLQPYESTPGVYFDKLGEVQLYNTEWKVVTYVNLEALNDAYNVGKKYIQRTMRLCSELEVNLTYTCENEVKLLIMQLNKTQNLRELIRQTTKTEEKENSDQNRMKRGVLNFVGSIAKILFGTLDSQDAAYYQSHIKDLESENLSMLKIAKEQMIVVKSTLQSMNSSLYDVAKNEKELSDNIATIRGYLKDETEQIESAFRRTEIEIAVNRHLIDTQGFLAQLKDHYEILLNGIMLAQKGVLQPQIISPSDIIRSFSKAQNNFPPGMTLPVELRLAYGYLITRIAEIEVFITKEILGYIVKVPLVDKVKYDLIKVIPFPTRVNGEVENFVFINSENEFILLDQNRQNYVMLTENQINNCKRLNDKLKVCKQEFAIKLAHSHEECVVKLLTGAQVMPQDCQKM
ncbi:uncharacterized protein [Anabrus simplex]|uniref:uncharacterized protein n=1 Tax=Anabrus simplex TaxID=316456 RepID=UPI0035A2A629